MITFEWLTRLGQKRPRLAMAITGSLISFAFGWVAWNSLDFRIRNYDRYGSEIPSAKRILVGVVFGLVSLAVAGGTLFVISPSKAPADKK